MASILFVIILASAALLYVNYRKSLEAVYYSEIEECTLPTITLSVNGEEVNRLYGYRNEMEYQYMRDTLCILNFAYDIEVIGELYGNTVNSIEFSLVDVEAAKLIQHNAADIKSSGEDRIHAIMHIENMIEEGKEYYLDIILTDGNNRKIHYYSRVEKNTTAELERMMKLVKKHHNAIYSVSGSEILAEYQATNSAVNDSTNFGNINLSSNLGAMTWGTMGVSVITEPVMSIVDIDNDIGYFTLKYQVGRTSEEGIKEYYNVSEFYRVRIYGEKEQILKYQRNVEQIFVPDASFVGNKSVMIGIDEDLSIQTMTNIEGNLNVFVAGKAVWFMDTNTKVLQKVFSFETVPTDIRQNYDQHDIKLMKINDNGDFQFIVYGYMNRGMHEGQVGMGLYSYSAERNEVKEDIYIPSQLPYQVLKNSIGSLCYLNSQGVLYILLDEFVYALDSGSTNTRLIAKGINENNFKASSDGRMIAWHEGGSSNSALQVRAMDLETGVSYYANASEGKSIKVLGFLNRDLVYGEGDTGNTYTTAEGDMYLLMDDVYVINDNKEILISEHSSNGFFVTSTVDYNRVVIKRVVKTESEYIDGDDFTFFATDIANHPTASRYDTYDEDRRTINYIEVVNTMDYNKTAVINDTMKITLSSAEATDVGDMISDTGKYYVYAAGEIEMITTAPAEAIMKAYYQSGVAVNENGQFYRRGSRPNTVELTDISIKNAVEGYKNGTALNITGIYLTQALYFTGKKIPVIWEWWDDTYVIYGYDLWDNLMLYNIDTTETLLVAYEDIDDIFDETGRCFIMK